MIKQKYITPVLMWLIIIVGVALIFIFLPARQLWENKFYFSWLIAPAAVYWLYILSGAARVHKKMAMSVAKIDIIVKEGVYAFVRHPIYSADIALAWGIFFFLGESRFLFAAIWLTLVMIFWAKLEERGLIEKFGQEYLDYKNQVPMVIPKLK